MPVQTEAAASWRFALTDEQLGELRAWDAYRRRYREAIHDDLDEVAECLVDMILEETFGFDGQALELQPASKSSLLDDLTTPLFQMSLENPEPDFTVEQGEAALAFLLERDLIEIDGDRITLPLRFAGDLPESLPSDDLVPEMP